MLKRGINLVFQNMGYKNVYSIRNSIEIYTVASLLSLS
jgi:hypothetical protein